MDNRTANQSIPPKKVNIAVSATFVAEPIDAFLSAWMRQLGVDAEIKFAPFNQVFQQLLSPASLLFADAGGIKVILLRFRDWHNESRRSANLNSVTLSRIEEFITSLSETIQRCPSTVLVFVCPEAPEERQSLSGEQLAQQILWEDFLVAKSSTLPGVHVVTTRELESVYAVADRFDTSADAMASIPYTPDFYAVLGTMVARKIHRQLFPPYKVVVLDCDGTLWGGICGEVGPHGIELDGCRRSLQAFIVEQYRQGLLVCLCSKNNESDVRAVFDVRKDLPLRPEHIAAWQINWRSKSDNILALSQELGLAMDSFVFIDNDPVECAEVGARCPDVLTLLLPADAASIPSFLTHLWAFDRDGSSIEDRERTQLYRDHFKRESLRRESPTLKDFLANLNLTIDMAPLVESDAARVAELTFRTNQFNLTSIKRSVAEINKFHRLENGECLTVRVKDRFGDYGLVGVVLYQVHSDALRIDTFLLSCRALGRGVEHRLLAALGDMALQKGLAYVDLCYVATNKNQPARDFVRNLVGVESQSLEEPILYRLAATQAARITYDPDREHCVDPQADAMPTAIAASQPGLRQRNALLSTIPARLHDPALIRQWVMQHQPRHVLGGEFVKPVTPVEVAIAAIFSEVLGLDQVGLHDGFFELGGHSLLAMQVLTRINAAFGVLIEPMTLFTTKISVAELVQEVLAEHLRQLSPQDVDALFDALSAITDDAP